MRCLAPSICALPFPVVKPADGRFQILRAARRFGLAQLRILLRALADAVCKKAGNAVPGPRLRRQRHCRIRRAVEIKLIDKAQVQMPPLVHDFDKVVSLLPAHHSMFAESRLPLLPRALVLHDPLRKARARAGPAVWAHDRRTARGTNAMHAQEPDLPARVCASSRGWRYAWPQGGAQMRLNSPATFFP